MKHFPKMAICCCILIPALGHAPVHARQQQNKVIVQDETGKVIHTSHYIRLAPGRVGVHATLFKYFGLGSGYDEKENRVFVFQPETCSTVGFRPNAHRLYNPTSGISPERYEYSIAKRRSGHIYVAANLVHSSFPDWFNIKWDNHTRTLILQKRRIKAE